VFSGELGNIAQPYVAATVPRRPFCPVEEKKGGTGMSTRNVAVLLIVLLLLAGCTAVQPGSQEVKIGVIAPLTGDIPKVGESTQNAAQMAIDEINNAGGLEIGGTTYTVVIQIEDNEAKAESAVAAATKLITQDNVVAIIGPQASKQAVPTGQVANDRETPMISPWSTNPDTTTNRPWVFRAAFLDPFQGPVVAGFAQQEFGAQTAAVLYDVASDYPKGLAENFRDAFQAQGGADCRLRDLQHRRF
jgi:branched-chain amino acid transport system substrate-binding protein